LQKFAEHEYEKVDRIVELFVKYKYVIGIRALTPTFSENVLTNLPNVLSKPQMGKWIRKAYTLSSLITDSTHFKGWLWSWLKWHVKDLMIVTLERRNY
jgi:hypothetical protein